MASFRSADAALIRLQMAEFLKLRFQPLTRGVMVELKRVLFHPRPAGGACLILYCYLPQSLALIRATNNSTRCSGPPEVQAEAAKRCSSVSMVTRLQVHQHVCLVWLILLLLNESFYSLLT